LQRAHKHLLSATFTELSIF